MIRSVRRAVGTVLRIPAIKRVLIEAPLLYKVYSACERRHPFDREHGVETSGYMAPEKIQPDPKMKDLVVPYIASQASIIRGALAALGDVHGYSELAEIARRNAANFAQRFPDRPSVAIHTQNILDYSLPAGKLVVYMYHSFGRPVLAEILRRLDASLASGHNTHIFLIYYNPVFGADLDALPGFSRWFAKTLDYAPAELGFGPDTFDTVVIWQSNWGAVSSPHAQREAPIVEIYSGWRAGLA